MLDSGSLDAARTLTEIVADRQNNNENRAAECLRALDTLKPDDLAREDYRAAALVFAQLAVATQLDAISFAYQERNL